MPPSLMRCSSASTTWLSNVGCFVCITWLHINAHMTYLDVKDGQFATSAVVNYLPPDELYKAVDLSLPEEGAGIDGMLSRWAGQTVHVAHSAL